MRSYSVKENPICSAVTEILRYKQTDTKTNTHPVTLLPGYLVVVVVVAMRGNKSGLNRNRNKIIACLGSRDLAARQPPASLMEINLLQFKKIVGRQSLFFKAIASKR